MKFFKGRVLFAVPRADNIKDIMIKAEENALKRQMRAIDENKYVGSSTQRVYDLSDADMWINNIGPDGRIYAPLKEALTLRNTMMDYGVWEKAKQDYQNSLKAPATKEESAEEAYERE